MSLLFETAKLVGGAWAFNGFAEAGDLWLGLGDVQFVLVFSEGFSIFRGVCVFCAPLEPKPEGMNL